MGEFRIAMGAVADVASSQDVRDAIGAGVDSIFSRVDDNRGTFRRLHNAVNIAAAGTYFVPFDSPAAGLVWDLRSCVVGTVNPLLPAAHGPTAFVGIGGFNTQQIVYSDFVSVVETVPEEVRWSRDQHIVHDGESVYVVVVVPTGFVTTDYSAVFVNLAVEERNGRAVLLGGDA